ncbi:MAG: phosphate signaling complex protein PhoU [Actinomycetota bacterium]
MGEHTVKSYDEELSHLAGIISRMGGIAEAQLAAALQALTERDAELAGRVVAGDGRIDELEHEVQSFTVRLLALRQPMAVDLRHIVAALKISGELERVGDYAANVAKRSLALAGQPNLEAVGRLGQLGTLVQAMLKDVLDAYSDQDVDKAVAVWRRDEEADQAYNALFGELIAAMMADPRTITAGTHLMFMAKNIERIGDHATNIAEVVHFLVRGVTIQGERPKPREAC